MTLNKIDLPIDADNDVCQYALTGKGRLILDTMHGTICIDVRTDDVNAFTVMGPRRDFLLIPGQP